MVGEGLPQARKGFDEMGLGRSVQSQTFVPPMATSSKGFTGNNYYCGGEQCRRTTRRLAVRMEQKIYYHCVNCGRRVEPREQYESSRAS